MRVALLSFNARAGDAIGNIVAEKLLFFLERGADVRVLLESTAHLHPTLQPFARQASNSRLTDEDWQFLSSADLVLVEYGQYYRLLDLLPILASGKPRILFDYHGVTPTAFWGTQHREALEKGATQRGLVWCADVAVAHSQFTRNELQRQTGFPEERLQPIGLPIDPRRFQPSPPTRDLRADLGLGQARLLLFVGRLAPNKRVGLLIDVVGRLRAQAPPIHAVIVGDTSDIYQTELQGCRKSTEEWGVADRVHFLGHVPADALPDIYRSADLFVMPSCHEGFCIPLLEAMACGVPVVAARSSALPETVGAAGLTFEPDDADDLERQIRRVLDSTSRAAPPGKRLGAALKIAIVALRYGTSFVGGAETSLRTIAAALHEAGHHIEVFTTCSQSEEGSNDLTPGTSEIGGVPVHRFRLDPTDWARRQAAVRVLVQAEGRASLTQERDYLAHSCHATELLRALASRMEQFDAVVTGPYLNGLTFDIAQAFPAKTILLPCFHDEPFARMKITRAIYEMVGSILYHTREEQNLAQTRLGLNHPGAACLGTLLDMRSQGDPASGKARVGTRLPYVVYCGRYSQEKNLPELLAFAKRYHETNPDRFTFVFMGQGGIAIPREAWVLDVGFVDEQSKRDLIAGAAALVQLSRNESLSLVALEAWAQGVPVIAHLECAVLAGHLKRGAGGRAINSYETFAAALDDLWHQPDLWQALGRQGKAHVQAHFGSREAFVHSLEESIHGLSTPLVERMRTQGMGRATEQDRERWRERWGSIVELTLDLPSRPYREQIEISPRRPSRTVTAGQESILMPVRLANRGSHAAVREGPARLVLRSAVFDAAGARVALPAFETPLPALLVPGEDAAASMRVPLPATPGRYTVVLRAEHAEGSMLPRGISPKSPIGPMEVPETVMQLLVEDKADVSADSLCRPILEAVQAVLGEAERRQQLPEDYTDVTEGFLGTWKHWLKRRLLGNFKHAYVDVLSRQQSAFNRHVLAALQEVVECCATLDHAAASDDRTGATHKPSPADLGNSAGSTFLAAEIESAVAAGKTDELAVVLQGILERLGETQKRCAALEGRVTRLELENSGKDKVRT